MTTGRGFTAVIAALTMVATLGSCGGSSRPSTEEWSEQWADAQRELPDLESLGDPPDREICDTALGRVRALDDLVDSPDEVIDDAARDWLQLAEMAMFTCDAGTIAQTYAEIAEAAAEIDAALALRTST